LREQTIAANTTSARNVSEGDATVVIDVDTDDNQAQVGTSPALSSH